MDIVFGTAAREQQSCFRGTLGLAARTPHDSQGQRHGHLLALGCENENLYPSTRELALEFFAKRRIKWWRNARSGDVKGNGPTRNLASSQVACVNFLLPLSRIPSALATTLRFVDDDVQDVVTIADKDGNESAVEFEWVGWDEPLEGGAITRGANQTSADALIVGKTARGSRAYLFEWKYCEEYSHPEYKGEGKKGETRRRRYSSLYEDEASSFNGHATLDEFLYEPFYQIMRLLLLGDKMRKHGVTPSIEVDEVRVVVVCPQDNLAYRRAVSTLPLAQKFHNLVTVEDIVKATLKDAQAFSVVSPEAIISKLKQEENKSQDLDEWLHYHELRYGW